MRGLSGRHMILLPLLACACQSNHVVRLGPSEAGSLPNHSWVVLLAGPRVPVEGGRFSRDSIIGTQGAGRRFAVSRDSVAFVEKRSVSLTRTVGALGLGFVGLSLAAALVVAALLEAAQ
jgi:hypothetical protein